MAVFDEPLRKLATNILKKFGGSATLRNPKFGYDPITGSEVKENNQDYAIRITPPEQWKQEQSPVDERSDQSNVEVATMQVYTDAKSLPVDPEIGWTLLWGRRTFRVVSASLISAGDDVVLWKLGLAA